MTELWNNEKKPELLLVMMMMMTMQADRHQEKLDLAAAKKIDADGLVNFITINEVRYVTEYNQVVGFPSASATFCSLCLTVGFAFSCPRKPHLFQEGPTDL